MCLCLSIYLSICFLLGGHRCRQLRRAHLSSLITPLQMAWVVQVAVVDGDVLWLEDPIYMWEQFRLIGPSPVAMGMAEEGVSGTPIPSISYYNFLKGV
jgi:hypothetical protein